MNIELQIRNLLNSNRKIEMIAEDLLNIAAGPETTQEEINSITQFLINCGLMKEAFRQFPRRFFEKQQIPWPHFIEITKRQKLNVNGDIVAQSIEGAKETKSFDQLVLNRSWDNKDVFIKEHRANLWQNKIEELKEKQKSLLQKIDFLKNHRMIEEEKKALEKYTYMFPEDSSIQQAHTNFKERWARRIIDRKIEAQANQAPAEEAPAHHSPEEMQILETILSETLNKKHQKETYYNFSIMFLNFEFTRGSLRVLQKAKDNEPSFWLKLELLFEDRKYLELLQEITESENKWSKNSEFEFAISYIKARALIKLGQIYKASEILKSIVSLRPSYRSASALLNQMMDGQI